MKTPVLKAARSGKDVRTAETIDLTIDSTKNQFKVHMEGMGTVNFVAKGAGNSYQAHSVDIEHNLGYQPSFLFWIKKPDGKVRLSPYIGDASNGPSCASSGTARVTDNVLRLYFYVWNPFLNAYSTFDVDYRYIIFVDPNKNVWS
jgi:hypothetical protein